MADETPNQKHRREQHEKSHSVLGALCAALDAVSASDDDEDAFRAAMQGLASTASSVLQDIAKEQREDYERSRTFNY